MTRLTLVFAAALLLAAGCGQSGPLYIPGNPSKVQMPPPQQDAADEEKDVEDD